MYGRDNRPVEEWNREELELSSRIALERAGLKAALLPEFFGISGASKFRNGENP
jgi:hypothetical protein